MENSIEAIWKQGFLNESSLITPKINDLYNQKSIHVVDKIKRKMKNHRTFNCILILFMLVSDYFLDVLWYGLAFTTMAFFMLWYTKDIINSINTFDQGATSYDYLKSFYSCLKGIFAKGEKIVQFSLPLYTLIGCSALWSVWRKLGMFAFMQHKHQTINIPLAMLAYLATCMVLVVLFSVKMYRWEVRIVYGRLMNKLEDTIDEMEKLKQGE